MFDEKCRELEAVDKTRNSLLTTLRDMIEEQIKAFVKRQKERRSTLNAPNQQQAWLLEKLEPQTRSCTVAAVTESGRLISISYSIDQYGMGGATEYHTTARADVPLDTLDRCRYAYSLLRDA